MTARHTRFCLNQAFHCRPSSGAASRSLATVAVEPQSTATARSEQIPDVMSAWVTREFGGKLTKESVPLPRIVRDDQVLIKVKASSINPIDVRMTEGYGNELLSLWRHLEHSDYNPITFLAQQQKKWQGSGRLGASSSRLPLVTGRDCCGEVVAVGGNVTTCKLGDEVIAVIPALWPGAHAEYVLASASGVAPKPRTVDATTACAYCYTACTAWAALVDVARIDPRDARSVRVLIHGGPGGVGTTAIQQLRAWGVPKVVATCSAKNADLVRQLGAIPVDYASSAARQEIVSHGPYEVILDCVSSPLAEWSDEIMGIWRNCVHVSVVSPLLADTDRYGVPTGLATTLLKYLARSYQPALQGRWFSYAFFMPNADCLSQLSRFIDEKKIVPVVEQTVGVDDIPAAYAAVGKVHGRGKTVVNFEK